jgi:hypothetical protein
VIRPSLRRALLALPFLVLAGCGGGPVDVQTAEAVPLRLERTNAERLVRSILGGYAAAGGADPFAAGLVSGSGDDLTLHPQRLGDAARAALRDADGDGALSWAEFSVLAQPEAYYAARALPPTVAALRATEPYATDDPAWFSVDVDGVMTAARRRVYVREAALRTAVEAFAGGGALAYPSGTWIVGEHLGDDGAVVETTVKRRRADGFWDFGVYAADGRLAPSTTTEPRPLRAAIQCTGCHLGQKRFEPEKSFPAAAPDGPFGAMAYHVPDAWRSAEATARFDEHARRSDGVLGLYATLWTGRMLAARANGTAAPGDLALLERLGL